MFVVKYRKIFFILSAVLIGLSLYGIFKYGFRESIDFKGGSLTEVSYPEGRPEMNIVETSIRGLGLGGLSVRPSGENSYIIRTQELNEEERKGILEALSENGSRNITIERSNTIGPVAGAELKSKAYKAVAVVVLMIVLFVTFAFRKVSKPIPSWKYGLSIVVALIHDVIIPTGVFVYLGHFHGTEIDLLFVTGLLAILGYSVHDTIVVFDRVRENLRLNQEHNKLEDFETTVGNSVHQTFGRSINTSLTIFITLMALYLYGGASTKDFSLLLIVGVIIGTYSSIFVASPLLVTLEKLQKNKI